ncbi:MAG: hypothetical protein M3Z24_05600, partial [Chloroflexota bacterium]|nr:hypothetical protein [Chloroflexota bacterium]
MHSLKRWYFLLSLILVLGIIVWRVFLILPMFHAQASGKHRASPTTPITHIVFIMMENHTFDNMFGRFPGVDGDATLADAPNPLDGDTNHSGPALFAATDGGKMDNFEPKSKVQYSQNDIPNYWAYAQNFGLSDRFFTSIATNSAPN